MPWYPVVAVAAFLGRFSSSLGAAPAPPPGRRRDEEAAAAPDAPAAPPDFVDAKPLPFAAPPLRSPSRALALPPGSGRCAIPPGRAAAPTLAPAMPGLDRALPRGGRPEPFFVRPARDDDEDANVSSAFVNIRSRFVGTLSKGLCWILPICPMADCAALARSMISRYEPFLGALLGAEDVDPLLPLLRLASLLFTERLEPAVGKDGRDDDDDDDDTGARRRAAVDDAELCVVDKGLTELCAGRLVRLGFASSAGVRGVPDVFALAPFRSLPFTGACAVVRGTLVAWLVDRSEVAFRFGTGAGGGGGGGAWEPASPEIWARRSPICGDDSVSHDGIPMACKSRAM